MIIQSLDGKWYREPGWFHDRYCISIIDDDLRLEYRGRVTWDTARRVLAPLDIKAKLATVLPDTKIIFGGRLRLASVFELHLIKPIPTPEYNEGFYSEAPKWEGKVLSWTLSGKRWTPVGETFCEPLGVALS